jgi:hypothetical protein
MIGVLVVDDRRIIREALGSLLQTESRFVPTAPGRASS